MNASTLEKPTTETLPGLLLVDDEQNVLSSLKRLFRKANCNVFIANSGQEGLEILEQQSIDVILSDARMPEMTGPEFLSKAAEQYPNTIRILLTGYAEMEAIIDAINLGKVSHYVEKPWDDEKLLALVTEAFTTINLKKKNEHLQAVVKSQNQKLKTINETLEATVKERTHKIIQINESLKENYKQTIDLFSGLLDMRQPKSEVDVPDILVLVKKMAMALALPEKQHFVLKGAAKMRYIGQVCLPDAILHTPYALLSKEQKHEYEQYPLTGSTILTSIPSLRPVADIISQHKEYLNGRGYPNGEWEKFISRPAQILTVANDYLELITGRMLEEPLSHLEAIGYLDSRAGDNAYYAADAVEALTAILLTLQTEQTIPEYHLNSQQLIPDMVLARDLKGHNGAFLLTKGTTLSEGVIAKLMKLEKSLKMQFAFAVHIPDGLDISKTLLDTLKATIK
ncbi:HD domain-containing phosphohydrolase [Marinomonas transparens]|uniref:Response regulator n=1 Tax=Marinomonas transparens TaxID=2795388 RepID=A0A934MZZ1_9GAMM|nr:HD domain-containing phosphohydrolase [Marinomonas transparens]MBJ7536182.1 response regulator [Marinomonas transparens]